MPDGAARRALLVSDFNLANLAGFLDHDPEIPPVASTVAPFGQVVPILRDPRHGVWAGTYEAVVVWTRPEGVVGSFQPVLECAARPMAQILGDVDSYADQVIEMSERACTVLVPTWVAPTARRGLGIGDLKPAGCTAVLARMNMRLIERLQDVPRIWLLNASRWIESAGPAAFSPKLWYTTKTPFAPAVFRAAAGDIKAALRALSGNVRKLILLDLDDTLWGGILGDAGWQRLRLGGHDPIGEAYVDFQTALKALRRRGVLLAIVSKNDEATALSAIRNHPEMVLRPDDFVGWRINWDDKAANIASLLQELNLGAESAVLIDDNPAERGRVREALPGVLVPEWPADRMLYADTLSGLSCFDTPGISDEDRARTQLYAHERLRESARASVGSLEDWLASLQIVVTVEALTEGTLKRSVQLLNKTNQLNLATRRLSEAGFWAWAQGPNRKVWSVRVRDRFGDSGLTGLVSVERNGSVLEVRDLVLSCRVFGRQIEQALLHLAVTHGAAEGCTTLRATYLPTPKNRPCLDFLLGSGLASSPAGREFRWDLSTPYPAPPFVTLIEDHVEADDPVRCG